MAQHRLGSFTLQEERFIFVVEDEEAQLDVLVYNLEADFSESTRANYVVEGFTNGASFRERLASLSVFERRRISIAIIDWMLPDISGIDLIQDIHQISPSCPVVMLSARSEEKDRVKGLDAGAFDYITKPYSVSEMVARMRGLVKRREASAILSLEMKNGSLEVGDLGENLRRVPTNQSIAIQLGEVTEALVLLTDAVRGDNALLGAVLKKQLIVTLKALTEELEGEFIDVDSVEKKAGVISDVGQRVSNEAVSKGLGNIFKRASDLVFDFVSNL